VSVEATSKGRCHGPGAGAGAAEVSPGSTEHEPYRMNESSHPQKRNGRASTKTAGLDHSEDTQQASQSDEQRVPPYRGEERRLRDSRVRSPRGLESQRAVGDCKIATYAVLAANTPSLPFYHSQSQP